MPTATLPTIPDTCPICGAVKSHDAPPMGSLRGRIYNCGAVVCNLDAGEWEVTIYCEKTGDVLAELRAEVARLSAANLRLGDQNVLMATELNAICELAEAKLGPWLPVSIEYLPQALYFAHSVYDLAVDALAGVPATEATAVPGSTAPGEPVSEQPGLEQVQPAVIALPGGVS